MPRLMTTRLADRVVRCLDENLAIRTAKLCWVECSAGPLKQAKAPRWPAEVPMGDRTQYLPVASHDNIKTWLEWLRR